MAGLLVGGGAFYSGNRKLKCFYPIGMEKGTISLLFVDETKHGELK